MPAKTIWFRLRCQYCGVHFEVPPSEENAKFCSVQCGFADRRERPRTQSLEARFWAKVEKSDGCWLWIAATNGHYGKISSSEKPHRTLLAHIVSYELHHGPVPGGKFVCHTCDNPLCVRPDHLFAGTPQENNDDMAAKERSSRALTSEQANEIRARYVPHVILQRDLAAEYRVGEGTIRAVIHGKWPQRHMRR